MEGHVVAFAEAPYGRGGEPDDHDHDEVEDENMLVAAAKRPGYLRNTFSLSVPDTNEASEVTRIRNTFRSHTCFSLKQLPNQIKPDAIRDHIRAHALKNQLGTLYTSGPEGVGIHAFRVPGSSSTATFGQHTYIPTDYNKGSDLRKAQLEEERNENASFSKRPFKVSASVDLTPAVPHDFGVDKEKKKKDAAKKKDEAEEDKELLFDVDITDLDDEEPERQVHRRLNELQLGIVVREEYSAANKSRFLGGDFRLGTKGHIVGSVDQPGIELNKSRMKLKELARVLYAVLDADWPNLVFKVSLDGNRSSDRTGDRSSSSARAPGAAPGASGGRGGTAAAPDRAATAGSTRAPSPAPASAGGTVTWASSLFAGAAAADARPSSRAATATATTSTKGLTPKEALGVGGDLNRVRSDQIVVQFETVGQTLPPLNALSKYMTTMSTHGKAGELGLRRRCDRWGVTERGLVKRRVPVPDVGSVVVRLEEVGVVKKVTKRPKDGSVFSLYDSSISTVRGASPAPAVAAANSGLRDNPVIWHDGSAGEEVEETVVEVDHASLRVLLHRAIPARGRTPSVGAYVRTALAQAGVDVEYLTPGVRDSSSSSGPGAMSPSRAAQPRRRSVARGPPPPPVLRASVHVHCTRREAAVPRDGHDGASPVASGVTPFPAVGVYYDIHGHAHTAAGSRPSSPPSRAPSPTHHSPESRPVSPLSSPARTFHKSAPGPRETLPPRPLQTGGFDAAFDVDTKADEVAHALLEHFRQALTPAAAGMRAEVTAEVTLNGQWLLQPNTAVGTATPIDPASAHASTPTPTPTPTTAQPTPQPTRPPTQPVSTTMDTDRTFGDDFEFPMFAAVVDDQPPPGPSFNSRLRSMLKEGRRSILGAAEMGNLRSHKVAQAQAKAAADARRAMRQHLAASTKTYTAQRRRLLVTAALRPDEDPAALAEHLVSGILQAAGLPPLAAAAGLGKGPTQKPGPPRSPASAPPADAFSPVPMALVADTVPTDDGEGWADALDEPLEVRADGMRETTLLTYAYYAPWVQITQLSAAKLAAKESREMIKKHRTELQRADDELMHRMETELFGYHPPKNVRDRALARDGGMRNIKYLVPELVASVKETVPDFDLAENYANLSPQRRGSVATSQKGPTAAAAGGGGERRASTAEGRRASTAGAQGGAPLSEGTGGGAGVGGPGSPPSALEVRIAALQGGKAPPMQGLRLPTPGSARDASSHKDPPFTAHAPSTVRRSPSYGGAAAMGMGIGTRLGVPGSDSGPPPTARLRHQASSSSMLNAQETSGPRHSTVSVRGLEKVTMFLQGLGAPVPAEAPPAAPAAAAAATNEEDEEDEEENLCEVTTRRVNVIKDTYREVRLARASAADRCGTVLGRKSLVPVRDMAGSSLLSKRSANRWRK